MVRLNVCDFDFEDAQNIDELSAICDALSNRVRLNMIKQLSKKSYTVAELKRINNISYSATLFHLNILEKANLISIYYLPGKKGDTQIVSIKLAHLNFEQQKKLEKNEMYKQSIGVGCFSKIQTHGNKGIAGVEYPMLWTEMDVLSSSRFNASLLWTDWGCVEYQFSNDKFKTKKIKEIKISLEICSEAHYYREDWKSDITFSINNVEVCTWQSPGDFGERKGLLNHPEWPTCNTQYGILLNICVNEQGIYINEKKYSDSIAIHNLKLNDECGITFKIESKEDAIYRGGFNIFGKSFGDYPQDIELIVVCSDKES